MTRRTILLALANALAIAAIAVWGLASGQWEGCVLGTTPGAFAIARWIVMLCNGPGFLVAAAVTSPLNFVAQHAAWAVAAAGCWLIYGKVPRMAINIVAGAALAGAIVMAVVAWRDAHDARHACWSTFDVPAMLAGISVLPGVARAGSTTRKPR